MTAEYAAIRVQLIDHDVLQVLEKLCPPWMMGKNSRVEHVRIAENQVRARANRPPCILWCIAVVREHADSLAVGIRQRLAQPLELGELILGERFCREQIERTARRILK